MSEVKKRKKSKLNSVSESDGNESEHELSYYMGDRVRLMKEVLKLVKPKKIKSMAPDCIKNLNMVEINSLLLEELLGISNKRLGYIFNGENVDRDTSSSDSDDEKNKIDVISLDDISDDDIIICDDKKTEVKNSKKIKKENEIKKEKSKKKRVRKQPIATDTLERAKLMSVLEILELQARARAIKSQLALEESQKKQKETEAAEDTKEGDSDPEAVIVQSPKPQEIVITSSDSENEDAINGESSIKDNSVGTTTQDPEEQRSQDANPEGQSSGDVDQPMDENAKKENFQKKVQKIRLIRRKAGKSDNAEKHSESLESENNEDAAETERNNVISTETVKESTSQSIQCEAEDNVAENEAGNENSNSQTTEGEDKIGEKETGNENLESRGNKFAESDAEGIIINLEDDDIENIDN